MKSVPDEINARIDSLETHMNVRFDEMHRLLLQVQSDLSQFYRALGYQDARLDAHDTRLDDLEGRQP